MRAVFLLDLLAYFIVAKVSFSSSFLCLFVFSLCLEDESIILRCVMRSIFRVLLL